MSSTPKPEPLMSMTDLAEYLQVPQATLYRWRYLGEGPKGARVGRWVRYRTSDVEAWVNARIEADGR